MSHVVTHETANVVARGKRHNQNHADNRNHESHSTNEDAMTIFSSKKAKANQSDYLNCAARSAVKEALFGGIAKCNNLRKNEQVEHVE